MRFLYLLAFVSGAGVMALEMLASRILAPYFGTSLLIWANLISVVLVALSLGYWLGGKLSDRYPFKSALFKIVFFAGVSASLIPFLSARLLPFASYGISSFSPGIFLASLFSVILLFAFPMTLLGMVSPFLVRLCAGELKEVGKTAGSLYAISTIGSIFGTFASVFIGIPYLGSRESIFAVAVSLMLVSAIGLRGRAWFLLVAVSIAWLALPGSAIKGESQLLLEGESEYNYYQVVERGGLVLLKLNEGIGFQSAYGEGRVFTGGYWDYFSAGASLTGAKKVLVIGSAGGTVAREFLLAFNSSVDAVELDGALVGLGYRYFGLPKEVNVFVDDGRRFVRSSNESYDTIVVDAFVPPYVPFHLATSEFFAELAERTGSDGVVLMNVPATDSGRELLDSVGASAKRSFKSVYYISLSPSTTRVLIASKGYMSRQEMERRISGDSRLPSYVRASAGALADVKEAKGNTDDLAPVEAMTHGILLDFLLNPGEGFDASKLA